MTWKFEPKRFALDVISFVTSVKPSRPAGVLGRQLLKSGTAIGANYREAVRAESRQDFIHKLAICERKPPKPNIGSNFFPKAGSLAPRRAKRY
jgi:hypothetical protein